MTTNPKLSSDSDREPPVFIDEAYFDRLQGMALGALPRVPSLAARLINEIERGTILPSHKMPLTVVNIGSQVTYRDEMSGRTRTVWLVLPTEADISQERVSVLTPIGAALIGLSEGACIEWETNGGEKRRLTILSVNRPSDRPSSGRS